MRHFQKSFFGSPTANGYHGIPSFRSTFRAWLDSNFGEHFQLRDIEHTNTTGFDDNNFLFCEE